MKSKIILINWALSFMGLCVVSPLWAVLAGFAWFLCSCLLLICTQGREWFQRELRESKLFNSLINKQS
ncbi:MAG: hypothetical protein LBG92_10450 [Prevotellaceae bacterium]|nr:hypothetical protein [Prevotellaceae bacterium]